MIKLTLICATFGRSQQLYDFVKSLEFSYANVDKSRYAIELIVVDQNEPGFIDFECFGNLNFPLIHLRSSKKGLSFNRNVGLASAGGDYVCFPDDDCLYYQATLSNLFDLISKNMGKIVLGRIYSKELGNILKNWPNRDLVLSKCLVYRVASSVTMFLPRDKSIYFDENLGVGAKYGSCEDPDYLLRYLSVGYSGSYFKDLHIWHPPQVVQPPLQKIKEYASGFGYLVSKWRLICLYFYVVASFLHKFIKLLFHRGYKFNHLSSYLMGFVRGFLGIDTRL